MRQLTASLALAVTLPTIAAAAAEDCDLQRSHWVCVPNQEPGAIQQFLDRFHKTVDRVLTPPGGWQQETAVPPAPVPQGAVPPLREEWRNAIIAEAERFCAAYPTDPVCHFGGIEREKGSILVTGRSRQCWSMRSRLFGFRTGGTGEARAVIATRLPAR